MRPSFRVGLFVASCIVGVLHGTMASAQPHPSGAPPPPPGPDRQNSQFTLRRGEAGGADAQTARARAQAGDCAGALLFFDSAIRITIDPSLRRDRGLCHEKVGDPFPAMDDYRAYLHARPEAPDAEDIRQRLAGLEAAHGTAGESTTSGEETNLEVGGGNERAAGTVTIGGRSTVPPGAAEPPAQVLGPKPGETRHEYDYYVKQEQFVDAARKSPLRYGSGVVLGPFVQLPRFFVGKGQRPGALAYAVGGAARYVAGPLFSIVAELGYGGIGTAGEPDSQSGVLLFGGAELRFPISKYASDHLVARGGFGYERQVVSGTRFINDNLLARFAFGYRHVFGTSLGLEALADGGPVLVLPERGDSRVNGVVGLSVAFVVGF